jgi:hypothetical protein
MYATTYGSYSLLRGNVYNSKLIPKPTSSNSEECPLKVERVRQALNIQPRDHKDLKIMNMDHMYDQLYVEINQLAPKNWELVFYISFKAEVDKEANHELLIKKKTKYLFRDTDVKPRIIAQ